MSGLPQLRSAAAALAEAVTSACGLPADPTARRFEHIGHYLMARAEGGVLPHAPSHPESLPAAELTSLGEGLSAAAHAAAVDVVGEGDELRHLALRLCPRAAPIPPDTWKTSYNLCERPPFIIRVDTFLWHPGSGFHFSLPRVAEAHRQSWELIKTLHGSGRIDRILLVCGNPGAGKSTFIETAGAAEEGAPLFFDDFCNSRERRAKFWAGYHASGVGLPVEAVCIWRDLERALAANESRGAKSGHEVPRAVMERLAREFEAPGLEEGFVRVRTFENVHNGSDSGDEGGARCFVLKEEVLPTAAGEPTVGA